MKVKVIRMFLDKETKKLHRAGDVIEISKRRYQEINGTALGVFVEEIKDTKKTKK